MTILGAVQQRGHRDVDAIYDPLSLAVAAAVLARSRDDVLPRMSIPAIVAQIGRTIDAARPALTATVDAALVRAGQAARPGEGVTPAAAPRLLLASRQRVAASLTTDRAGVLRQTTALLLTGAQRELRAAVIAKTVQQYFAPFFAPRRDSGGVLRREGRSGAVQSWPGQAGMASQHARLVMLTETSAVYNGTLIAVADRDDELLRYTLALRHTDRDLCDEWARVNTGYGPGIYRASDAPAIPNHPRCRCYYEPAGKVPSFSEEQFVRTGKRRAFPLAFRP